VFVGFYNSMEIIIFPRREKVDQDHKNVPFLYTKREIGDIF